MIHPWPTPGANTADGKRTASLPPTLRWVGRLLDSHETADKEQNPGVLRAARSVKMTAEGIAMAWYWVAVYFDKARLIQRLTSGEGPSVTYGNGELYLYPDGWFNPREGWNAGFADTHGPITAVDIDDRGVVYPACTLWGWGGVVHDPGQYFMRSLFHAEPNADTEDPPVAATLAFAVGGDRYAIASSSSGDGLSALYSVNATPERVRTIHLSIRFSATGTRAIGIIGFDGRIRIFTPEGLLSGSAVYELPATIKAGGIATDGTNFYVIYEPSTLYIISPSGASYTYREVTLPLAMTAPKVSCGADYLAVFGQDPSGHGANLRLFRAADLSEVPLGNFFQRYYSRNTDEGYAVPPTAGFDTLGAGCDVGLFARGGKRYLLALACSLCDLYEVVDDGSTLPPPVDPPPSPPPDPDQVFASLSFSPANPRPLDVVTFADTSSGPVVSRSWTFGDGSPVATGQTVTHPYAAGTFVATLTVRSAAGKESTRNQTVTVANPAPPPPPLGVIPSPDNTYIVCQQFGFATPPPMVPGVSLDFFAQVRGWTKTGSERYSWHFLNEQAQDDGPPSPLAEPTHVFARPGAYTVLLLLTTNAGAGYVKSLRIVIAGDAVTPPVDPPPPPVDTSDPDLYDPSGKRWGPDNIPPRPIGLTAKDVVQTAGWYRKFSYEHIEYKTITGLDVAAHQFLAYVGALDGRPELREKIGNWILAGRPAST